MLVLVTRSLLLRINCIATFKKDPHAFTTQYNIQTDGSAKYPERDQINAPKYAIV
jgi:hypothetical protein